ncbi:DUF6691 family protein [Rhodohalobacter sp. 614A]|uniref:DUF6691 family protein n=1 Tax=Rhodohalobacter sp. 614A TaxID=2908649 RepID=UPI001F15C6A2|nr:DUF6691 family protein [Rhodohalobacter sp. 614A]
MLSNLRYLLGGVYFGFILVKSEVVSWFRIQEMFRFQDFHMYGIIGSAIIVGIISIQIIKRLNIPDIEGNPISIPPKDTSQWKRYIIGGSMFGLGWALLGACPGPIFALLGTGLTIMLIPIATAILGTWLYGAVRHKLPH